MLRKLQRNLKGVNERKWTFMNVLESKNERSKISVIHDRSIRIRSNEDQIVF